MYKIRVASPVLLHTKIASEELVVIDLIIYSVCGVS